MNTAQQRHEPHEGTGQSSRPINLEHAAMSAPCDLYPLRFEPIYQYRPWGGRRLADLLSAPLPGTEPIGEAWLLSDRDEHPSRVANGPLKGQTLGQLMERSAAQMLGTRARSPRRFPLLLKFLDVRERLSVQVHPSDRQASSLLGGEHGKTEGWVVLEAGPSSLVYAGLEPATTEKDLRRAIASGTVPELLHSFRPSPGDSVLLEAGTVHSARDLVVFEVQENSDVTFRLYDWDRVDGKTGQPRPLQVGEALACVNFERGVVRLAVATQEEATPVHRERLLLCGHFGLWRLRGRAPFSVGTADAARALVCIEGNGQLEHDGTDYPVGKGDVLLLPAVVGTCSFRPMGPVNLLEVSVPDEDVTQ